jgi:hypothetical protein
MLNRLLNVNQVAKIQGKSSNIKKRLRKFPETVSMCESSNTNIPDWLINYQSDDPNEKKLIYLFRQLFLHDVESKQHQQALSKIYNILVIKKFLQLPGQSEKDSDNSNKKSEKSNIDYGKAIEQNLKWLTKPLIVITPDLQTLLENYCQQHPQVNENNLIIKLNKHLNNLKLQPVNSTEYRHTYNYLTPTIKKLIKTLKDNNDPFLDQLQPLIKYWRRIQFFDPNILPEEVRPPEGFYLQQGLSIWIKTNLNKRVSDLFNPQRNPEPKIKDKPIDENKTPDTPKPRIDDLNREDFYNPKSQDRVITFLLFNYLKHDPDGYLVSRHVKGYPECTYKVLAEYFINDGENEQLNQGKFAFPHGRKQELAERFGIPYQKLVSGDILRHFLPFVAALPLKLGSNKQLLKTAIEEDSKKTLQKCQKIIKGVEIYNARSLAMELLPMFHTADEIVNAVTNDLERNGYNVIVPAELINATDPPSLVFTKIFGAAIKQTRKLTNVYQIQGCWENAIIEKVTEQVNQQHSVKVTQEETLKFWETKCLPRLGKLDREIYKTQKVKS